MSQAQDMAAINNLFERTTPTNSAAAAIQSAWFIWYRALSAFERDYDADVLSDAGLRRDAFNKANAKGTVNAPAPLIPIPIGPRPTIKKGSKDPAGTFGPVKLWQTIVGATPVDGIFGSGTEKLTKDWQKAHGLVNDGIVGPLTWAQADANSAAASASSLPVDQAIQQAIVQATVQTAANTPVAVAAANQAISQAAEQVANQMVKTATTSPEVKAQATQAAAVVAANAAASQIPVSSSVFPVIREGSKGEAVKTWQGIVNDSPADGVFDANLTKKTKAFQTSRGILADGIVGPETWTTASLPQANTALLIDPVGQSAEKVWNAVKHAVNDVIQYTPPWLKATGIALVGWSVILMASSKKKSV